MVFPWRGPTPRYEHFQLPDNPTRPASETASTPLRRSTLCRVEEVNKRKVRKVFIGAINQDVRQFLGNVASVFNGKVVVVGCSGNFTSESILTQYARPASIHSNDVSFYSTLAGRWLLGEDLDFELVDPEWEWLRPYLGTPTDRVATVMLVYDLISRNFWPAKNVHTRRMLRGYREQWDYLMEATRKKLGKVQIGLTSYYCGDVFDHFMRFADQPDAVFCCYAPTWDGASGPAYDLYYRRLTSIFRWSPPEFKDMNAERRDALFDWMSGHAYVWYGDRLLPGRTPVVDQRSNMAHPVFLYSNCIDRTAYLPAQQPAKLLPLPLAGPDLEITPRSLIRFLRIKAGDMRAYKYAYLGKIINPAQGSWAFAVHCDDKVIGFLEFYRGGMMDGPGDVYLVCDFPVSGTPYKRLSKLIIMLAISGETRRLVERCKELRLRSLHTTAFTDRPVSMKYRGVLELAKRGVNGEGQTFLNYTGKFNDLSWKETLRQWLQKNASPSPSQSESASA